MRRNGGGSGSGSWVSVLIVMLVLVLLPVGFFFGVGMYSNKVAGHSQSVDTPEKLARRQLRDKRREIRAAELVKKDDDVIIKLENAAIQRSKSVDSAVLGKYSIWRKENDNENTDTTI
ncbi:polygalacturonate 4-alpha-galacturonosyltransferase-like protein [Tanacetum coccineum]